MKDFPYGTVLEQAPPDYVPPDLWPEYYAIADPVGICSREALSINPATYRWAFGPLCFEQYMSDEEPVLAPNRGVLARNRFVTWIRLDSKEKPKGWLQLSRYPWRVDGLYKLDPAHDYTLDWHKNARRDISLWRRRYSQEYTITPLTRKEFADNYRKSLIGKRLGTDRLDQLERRLAIPGAQEHIALMGIKNSRGEVVAGCAIIFSTTYRHSTHMAPFITAEGGHINAATVLVDYWFKESQKRGYLYVMSTNFYYRGQPKSWRGFSQFKSHFGFSYVAHQPALWKFVRGKIF